MEDQNKKISLVKFTVGISHLPEMDGKAIAYFPTHNFDILKLHRENLFYKFIQPEFLKERKIKRVFTTYKDTCDLRTDWLNGELKEIERLNIIPGMSRSDLHELGKYREYVNNELTRMKNIQITETLEKTHLLSIPTKASPEDILSFWLKLTGNNEKGQPYWENEKEIEHFINQNFVGFPGVDEIKEFAPNMNKSELNQVVWTFLHTYGISKSKRQYENLSIKNFSKFKDDKNVYSNIKDQSNEHLKRLFK